MSTVNGKPHPPGPLLSFLESLGHGPETRGLAIALNGAVVPRSRWTETTVAEGDAVEVVKVFQGG
ncbi:sulfur carrier protein ThiS [Aerophototrophica crusticola]|uniref:Sulfur carrier protein ThiS n=1 Tax=Aerophototrophica crusticola TaxID=1709002 RepID=A0A858RAR4_9PROT|nr:sulfur carrier protein ThiS [Rhodospirillaceae bacterium B3]